MFFNENYGGGPEIVINSNGDIYSSTINMKNYMSKSCKKTSSGSPYNSLGFFDKSKNDQNFIRKDQKIIPTYISINTDENNSKCDDYDEILNENTVRNVIINNFPIVQIEDEINYNKSTLIEDKDNTNN
jgi:hypothetical protein